MFALLAATGVVMVLIARGHYTVDCLIAYFVTTRIFYIYHTLANNQNLKVSGCFVTLKIFRKIPNPDHCGVGAHQRQGKTSEKSEEEERDGGTEHETS